MNITIETPDLDHKLNEQFEIEIGSNQRLRNLQATILEHVKSNELKDLIRREKMFIYIEGKKPVSRKSKSLSEMGVNDGDTLIVTTEMKLPFNDLSDEEDGQDINRFPSQSNLGEMGGPPMDSNLQANSQRGYSQGMSGGGLQNMGSMPQHSQGQLPHQMMMNQGHMRTNGDRQRMDPNPHMPMGMGMKPDHGQHMQMGVHGMGNKYPNPMMNRGPMMTQQQKDQLNKKMMPRKPAPPLGDRKVNPQKSPGMKKPKEIQYVKLKAI